MNPQSPKNINNGRTMDVMSGRNQASSPSPQPGIVSNAPADDIAQASETPPMSASPAPKRKLFSLKRLLIVIVVLGVVAGVVAGTLYYLDMRDDTSQEETANISDNTALDDGTNGKVTGSEIDETVSEIDKTLNTLDDSGDFTQNDLSNEALGL